MTITGAIVLFAVTWFMVFFCVLPWQSVSQLKQGEIVPGTPSSAPVDPQIRRKAKITTVIALGIWVVLVGVIMSGLFSVMDMDVFNIMGKN